MFGIDLSRQAGSNDLLPQLHRSRDAVHRHGNHVQHAASRFGQQAQQTATDATEEALHAAVTAACRVRRPEGTAQLGSGQGRLGQVLEVRLLRSKQRY